MKNIIVLMALILGTKTFAISNVSLDRCIQTNQDVANIVEHISEIPEVMDLEADINDETRGQTCQSIQDTLLDYLYMYGTKKDKAKRTYAI